MHISDTLITIYVLIDFTPEKVDNLRSKTFGW